jgi:hypothetical protein
MKLSGYLKSKHIEYIQEKGEVVSVSDWVKQGLNPKLPAGDKIAITSFNQWISEDRSPDGKNVIRLITVFNYEVLPYLGADIPPDLATVGSRWPNMSEAKRQAILDIANNEEPELATLQV